MSQPFADEKIWEALEVCRPDRDAKPDPALSQLVAEMAAHPELRDRYERIQGFDARLIELFSQVSPPPGLAERIKSKVEADQSSTIGVVVSQKPAENPVSQPISGTGKNLSRKRMISRRWPFITGGLLTTTAALFVMLYFGLPKSKSYTQGSACQDAIRFFEEDRAGTGTLWEKQAPPGGFALSLAVVRQKEIRWRKISNFLGCSGIAFDLPTPEGTRATLYVVRCPVEGIPPQPTLPNFATGGCAILVWQEEGLFYALVIRGDPQIFRHLLNLPRSPLA